MKGNEKQKLVDELFRLCDEAEAIMDKMLRDFRKYKRKQEMMVTALDFYINARSGSPSAEEMKALKREITGEKQ